mgnify:CR=1 FL=1
MFLIGTVAIAAIVGIIYALIFGLDASSIDLGNAEHSRGSEISKQAKDLTANTLPQQILVTKQSIFRLYRSTYNFYDCCGNICNICRFCLL